MRLLFVIVLFLSVTTSALFAQIDVDEEAGYSLKERGYIGLGLGGLAFGNSPYYGQYFSVGVSAQVGYMLTSKLSTGLGFEYQYTNYSDLKLKNNVYVAYPFVRYNIKNFFLQADYDNYSFVNVLNKSDKQRRLYDRFFIGVGYSSPTNARGRVNFLVSYDFLYVNGGVFTTPLSTRFYITF